MMGLYESYMGVYGQDEYIEEDVEDIEEELTGSRLRRANQRMAQIDAELKKPGNKTNTDLWAKRARLRAVSGNAEGSSVAGVRRALSWEGDYKGPRGRGGGGFKGGPKTVGQSSSLDRPSGGTTSDSILKGIRRHDKKSINASYDYDYDLYDLVLEYLLDEGLCESVENAEIMMAHMSEGWVDAIVESYELDEANRGERHLGLNPDEIVKRRQSTAFPLVRSGYKGEEEGIERRNWSKKGSGTVRGGDPSLGKTVWQGGRARDGDSDRMRRIEHKRSRGQRRR